MLALPELKNNWRHTYVRRFRDDAERSRLECLPRQLFIFRQSYANNLATTTCAHETAGKKEKWKVVKRRSLSMHKCLIQLHHSRASSGCVRCDYTFAAAIAKPRRWDRLTPKDLSIFLMDLLSLPSRPPTPYPPPILAVHKTFVRFKLKTKTILMLTWHIFNRCQSNFSCEKRVLDWDEVYYGCRRFSLCCCCAAAASQIPNVLNWIISSGSDPVQMTNRI